jgi:hypothetical protein
MKKQSNLPGARRKLSLNKKTISNLTASEMKQRVGGHATKGHTCGLGATCYTCGRTACGTI